MMNIERRTMCLEIPFRSPTRFGVTSTTINHSPARTHPPRRSSTLLVRMTYICPGRVSKRIRPLSNNVTYIDHKTSNLLLRLRHSCHYHHLWQNSLPNGNTHRNSCIIHGAAFSQIEDTSFEAECIGGYLDSVSSLKTSNRMTTPVAPLQHLLLVVPPIQRLLELPSPRFHFRGHWRRR